MLMFTSRDADILELKQVRDDLLRAKTRLTRSRLDINYDNGALLNSLIHTEHSSKRMIDILSRNILLK